MTLLDQFGKPVEIPSGRGPSTAMFDSILAEYMAPAIRDLVERPSALLDECFGAGLVDVFGSPIPPSHPKRYPVRDRPACPAS